MALTLSANFTDPDAFYAALLREHEGLAKEESDAYNARLIFVLANHIGDQSVLAEALETARQST